MPLCADDRREVDALAYDGSIRFDTAIDGSGFKSGLSKISDIAKSALGAMTGVIGGASAALSAGALAGVKYNSQMEQYMTSFSTMLGSAGKAQSLVGQLKQFAAATPFEFTDLAKGTQTLLAFGVSSKDVMGDLKMLGDVSQGNKERFDALSLAFAQVSSAGKMQGQDLLQMVNAGFNPLNVMTKTTGKSMAELRQEMEKGQISAADVAQAFKDATSKGGQFYNAMDSQSKTFNGQLSTLKDNSKQFLGEITQGFTNSLKDTALPLVNGWMTQLSDAFNSGGVSGVVSALGTVLAQAFTQIAQQAPGIIEMATSLLITFVNGIEQNSDKIADAAAKIIVALVKAITVLLPKLVEVGGKILSSLLSSLGNAYPQIKPIADAIKLLVDNFDKLLPIIIPLVAAIAAYKTYVAIATAAQWLWNAAMDANPIGIIIVAVAALVAGIIYLWNTNEGFRNAITSIWNGIADFFTKTIPNAFKATINWIKNNWQGLLLLLVSPFAGAFKLVYDNCAGFRNFINGFIDGIKAFFTNAWNWAQSFFSQWGPLILTFIAPIIGIPLLIKQHWSDIQTFFVNLWSGITSFFTETIPAWIQSVIQWFQQLPYNIGLIVGQVLGHIAQFGINAYTWVTTELPKIIQGIITWFSELPGKIWGFLTDIVTKIGTWGSNTLSAASTAASNTVNSTATFFSQLPGKIWTHLTNIVGKVGTWGANTLTAATTWIGRTISSVVTFFSQLPGKIWTHLVDAATKVKDWAGNLITTAATEIPKFVAKVVSFMSELPNKMIDIGKNIVKGIWDGITGMIGWIKDKVSGFCNGVLDGFKAALGIHSPSKLMADKIGAFLPPGITVGMDKTMPDTINSIKSKMSAMMDKARETISAEQAKISTAFGANTQYQVALAGGYAATEDGNPATPQFVVESRISMNDREFAVAAGPAIAKQIGWKGN